MRIGILGAGQLGRMLALAGYPLGFQFRAFDVTADAVGGHVMPLTVGSFTDHEALAEFASGLEVVTYEFENVPVAAAEFLARRLPVHPPPAALEASQERIAEKTFFQKLGIPTPRFQAVSSRSSLTAAVASVGLPAVLKTCRLGYDGKGQQVLRQPADLDSAWNLLGGVPLILEGFVPFDREVSIVAVRGTTDESVYYPLVQNHHQGGILKQTLAPVAQASTTLQRQAEDYAARVLSALHYVGTLAIEFFQVGEQLIANEMAPRVHNSGHWTMEGAATSQFDNHLRAITGLPLGPTHLHGHVGMINILGGHPELTPLLRLPHTHVHFYGKAPHPGRKLGHVTIVAPTETERDQLLIAVLKHCEMTPVS
jgi:5-(carboxyamino)imidazole ribonucleotide synthase